MAHGVRRETGDAPLLGQTGNLLTRMRHGPFQQQRFQRIPVPGSVPGVGEHLEFRPVWVAGGPHQVTPVAFKDCHQYDVSVLAGQIDIRHQCEAEQLSFLRLVVGGVGQLVGHDRRHPFLQAEVDLTAMAAQLPGQQRGHAGRRAKHAGHQLPQRCVGREWRFIFRIMHTVGDPWRPERQTAGRHCRQLVPHVMRCSAPIGRRA